MVAADTLAWCLHKTGNHGEAAKMIRRALKWSTPNPEFHFHAGMIYLRAGKTAEGRTLLRRVVEVNPRYNSFHAHR